MQGLRQKFHKPSRNTVRLLVIFAYLLLQIALLITAANMLATRFVWFYAACELLALFVTVRIINKKDNPAYKLAWIIPILTLPVLGILLYFTFRRHRPSRRTERRIEEIGRRYHSAVAPVNSRVKDVAAQDPGAGQQTRFLDKAAMAPVYGSTVTRFFPLGDDAFPVMVEELKKAEKFIFLEYFIIAPGVMWNTVLEILREKALQGLDVRVMYDDVGCINTLPPDYCQQLEGMGIRACVFNKFNPFHSGAFNNRDHRKILVIDGNVCFSGGINLADEYINEKPRFGHWLDCALMLRGEATRTFTAMFLSMWDYVYPMDSDYEAFLPDVELCASLPPDGYVQPYSGDPGDTENCGQSAYLGMITHAREYLYITTPYLVLDDQTAGALCLAARSGVDVRVMTPGIPDKPIVFQATRSYYPMLLQAGVKIYEYSPGFVHAKCLVSDDSTAICGTINMDYRSLFLNYECAVWMYRTTAVGQIKNAFLDNQRKCRQITMNQCSRTRWYIRALRNILRIFSPMM